MSDFHPYIIIVFWWSPVWSVTKQGEKLKKDWAGREKGGWGKGGYCIGEKTKCIVNGGIIK